MYYHQHCRYYNILYNDYFFDAILWKCILFPPSHLCFPCHMSVTAIHQHSNSSLMRCSSRTSRYGCQWRSAVFYRRARRNLFQRNLRHLILPAGQMRHWQVSASDASLTWRHAVRHYSLYASHRTAHWTEEVTIIHARDCLPRQICGRVRKIPNSCLVKVIVVQWLWADRSHS